jgi:hypothetical protein
MKAVARGTSAAGRAAGAVLLGLRTAADVARALEDLRARIARLEPSSCNARSSPCSKPG